MPSTVLYVHYVPNPGGAAKSLQTLIKNLDRTRFVPRALLTHHVAEPALGAFRKLDVPAEHFPTRMVWDQPWYSRENFQYGAHRAFAPDRGIARQLERLKPDIVHINDFLPVPVAYTAVQMGIPVVWHCRSVLLYRRPIIDPGARIIATVNRLANKIVGISEPEAEQFASSKAEVVYNPLELGDLERARGTGAAVRAELGIAPDEILVHAPIPLVGHKGAWDFLEAAAKVAKRLPGTRFRFLITGLVPGVGRRHLLRKYTGFGPEPELDRAKRFAQSKGIGEQLMITGFRNDIYSVMDAADMIVFPSHLKACGRQCFEGGAMGKPVIVTMPEKNTRVIVDGETGMIVKDRDPDALAAAMEELARDPAKRRSMGDKAAEYVPAHFESGKHARRIMQIYDELGRR